MIHRITIPQWRPATINWLMYAKVLRRIKLRKADDEMVGCYARQQDIPRALGKRRVSLEITLTGRQKETDPGAYEKSLADSLVKCGMLMGDSRQFVEYGTVTYSRGVTGGTVIVLEDLELLLQLLIQ